MANLDQQVRMSQGQAHDAQMVFAREMREARARARADGRFARRFAESIRKHDANAYGG